MASGDFLADLAEGFAHEFETGGFASGGRVYKIVRVVPKKRRAVRKPKKKVPKKSK